MSHAVLLTDDAVRDLDELYDYVAEHDSPAGAAHVLDRLEALVATLADSPLRGSFPKELLALGIREYRELWFKPYRVVYRVSGEAVTVYLIADGRRELQTLLARRLLAS